jgi:hypothetical protein
MREAKTVDGNQRPLRLAHHRAHPGKPSEPLVAEGGKQRLGTSDRPGKQPLQALGVGLAHPAADELGAGPPPTHAGCPSCEVALGLSAPDRQAGKGKARDDCVGTPAASAPQADDQDPAEEVVLLVAAMATQASLAPTGGTTTEGVQPLPAGPHLGGVIVFLGTVEYKYCVGLGVGRGPARHRKPRPISRPPSGTPQLQ